MVQHHMSKVFSLQMEFPHDNTWEGFFCSLAVNNGDRAFHSENAGIMESLLLIADNTSIPDWLSYTAIRVGRVAPTCENKTKIRGNSMKIPKPDLYDMRPYDIYLVSTFRKDHKHKGVKCSTTGKYGQQLLQTYIYHLRIRF